MCSIRVGLLIAYLCVKFCDYSSIYSTSLLSIDTFFVPGILQKSSEIFSTSLRSLCQKHFDLSASLLLTNTPATVSEVKSPFWDY